MSVKLTNATGTLRSNWMLDVFLASCLLAPWLWFTPARLPELFALIYLAVARGQMAIVPNIGAPLHHVILLWRFPDFLVVAGAQMADSLRKYGACALTVRLVAIVGCNAVVINHYADLVTRGTVAKRAKSRMWSISSRTHNERPRFEISHDREGRQ